jgi:hypothetical protein
MLKLRVIVLVGLVAAVVLAGEGSGTSDNGSLRVGPRPVVPARLSFSCQPFNTSGDQKWDGGEQVGVKVTVRNDGKGAASGVKVTLAGDDYLTSQLGSVQWAGDVGPGQSRDVRFDATLPPDCPTREALLRVSVAGASEVQELHVALVPAPTQVKRDYEKVYPVPAGSGGTRKSACAVVIGIQNYPSATKLKYAASDASAFADYAVSVFGIPRDNVKLLTEGGATKTRIQAVLQEWLVARKPEFVVVYYSGHGLPVMDTLTQSWQSYLVPFDADPDYRSTLMPVSELTRLVEASGADTILTFYDACFSGQGGKTPELASKPLPPPGGVQMPTSTRAVTFSSSAGNQESRELDGAGAGLFTYYLLLGLKNKPVTDANGWVTLDKLFGYVDGQVTRESNGSQTPVLDLGTSRLNSSLRLGKRD